MHYAAYWWAKCKNLCPNCNVSKFLLLCSFFRNKRSQLHGLNFSQNILLTEKKNQGSFKKITSTSFPQKIWSVTESMQCCNWRYVVLYFGLGHVSLFCSCKHLNFKLVYCSWPSLAICFLKWIWKFIAKSEIRARISKNLIDYLSVLLIAVAVK